MRSKTDYLDFYEGLRDFPLAVSRETGTLLYMLARGCRAQTIVEFGTSFLASRPCTSPQHYEITAAVT